MMVPHEISVSGKVTPVLEEASAASLAIRYCVMRGLVSVDWTDGVSEKEAVAMVTHKVKTDKNRIRVP